MYMKNIILILLTTLLTQCRIVRNSFEIKPYRIEIEDVVKRKNHILIKPKIHRFNAMKSKYWYKYTDTSINVGDTITMFLIYDKKYPIK
jgi:hypothetical protein